MMMMMVVDEEACSAECPVCYERVSDAARTLSCGHAFCHDCLVGTFVCSNRDGVITRDTIICPVCRHVTFVTKVKGLGGEEKHAKVLEVPLRSVARAASARSSSEHRYRRMGRCFRWIASRIRRQRLVCPKDSLQVFIISDVGRPLAEEDMVNVGTPAVIRARSSDRGFTMCSTSQCLLFLLIIFTILSLIAATLPWVFLA